MKTTVGVLVSCIAIACSTSSFSWWSKWDSCNNETGFDDNYCTTCQCVDLGYGRNDCVSLSEYCDAFGNIGDR